LALQHAVAQAAVAQQHQSLQNAQNMVVVSTQAGQVGVLDVTGK
jgi:hypothetical protein